MKIRWNTSCERRSKAWKSGGGGNWTGAELISFIYSKIVGKSAVQLKYSFFCNLRSPHAHFISTFFLHWISSSLLQASFCLHLLSAVLNSNYLKNAFSSKTNKFAENSRKKTGLHFKIDVKDSIECNYLLYVVFRRRHLMMSFVSRAFGCACLPFEYVVDAGYTF